MRLMSFIPYPKALIKKLYFFIKYNSRIESANVAYSTLLGREVVIKGHVISRNSRIGDLCYINHGAEIYSADIGKYCSIGQYSQIGPNEHDISNITTCEALYSSEMLADINMQNSELTKIGPDVWVGSRAIILKGVTVGVGSVIAAGAVVTKEVPPYAVVAGIPAKIIRYRFTEKEISALVGSVWWNYDCEDIRKYLEILRNRREHRDIEKFINMLAGNTSPPEC